MEPKGTMPCSQSLPFAPILSQINSVHTNPISLVFILISSSHLYQGFPSCLFPSGFPTKTRYIFHFPQHMPHAPPISSSTVWLPQYYVMICTNHKAAHYTLFSILLSLPPTQVQTFSSAKSAYLTIMVLYIFIFEFLDDRGKTKNFGL